MSKIIDHLSFSGSRMVLSIGHRSILAMLLLNPPSVQMSLDARSVGDKARQGILELRTWGLITLMPILTESERYELKLTVLGRNVAIEIRDGAK